MSEGGLGFLAATEVVGLVMLLLLWLVMVLLLLFRAQQSYMEEEEGVASLREGCLT